MYCSKKILLSTLQRSHFGTYRKGPERTFLRLAARKMGSLPRCKAFSLIETVAALAILTLISFSVLVVIDRCMASAADSALRMEAFRVARENMEKLLALDSVKEMVEYGSSDKNPDIQWETAVETFYEPVTSRMWVRAVCSAEYTDTAGEVQTIELTHWLTSLTKQQLIEIVKEREKERLAKQTFETIEEAAEHLGVDAATVQQWIDNGMRTMADGSIPIRELDLYEKTDGNPTIEDRIEQVAVDRGLEEQPKPEQGETERDTRDTEMICGYTIEELMQMPFDQVWQIFLNWDGS